MLAHRVIGCTVILAAVVSAAPPVRACESPPCLVAAEAEPASAPLQLNTFMRRNSKAARSKVAQRTQRTGKRPSTMRGAQAAPRKRIKAVKRPVSKDRIRQVARPLTVPAPLVRFNDPGEINRAARTASAGQASMAFAAEPAVRPSDATDTKLANEIEPEAEAASPQALAAQALAAQALAAQALAAQASAPPVEIASAQPILAASEDKPTTDTAPRPDNWAMRVWTMLERGFSAVAIGARRLAE